MDRAEYNRCMAPHMRGQKSKEQRQMDTCIGAKLCTSKAKTPEEAKGICSLPRPPKPQKAKRSPQTCKKEVLGLAHCMTERIDMKQASNINSIEVAIVNAMLRCKCGDAG